MSHAEGKQQEEIPVAVVHTHTHVACKSLLSWAGWVFIVDVSAGFLALGFAGGLTVALLSYRPHLGISHDCLTILNADNSNVKLPFSLLLPPFQSRLVS